MARDYFYDQQLRRYWMQFVRIFEDIKIETGRGADGQKVRRTVPAKWALRDRLVGHILRNNSENTIGTTPSIACYMTGLARAPERIQNPNHIDYRNVVERFIDPVTNKYTDQPGRSYTVERFMSVPYTMNLSVDIWTSNEDQKAQIMEQLLILFNPSIDLQTGDNPLDWTSLGIVSLDDIQWSSRSIPIGSEDDIDITTLTFTAPIWLSPPAKVKKQNLINQIVTNISMTETLPKDSTQDIHWSESDMRSRLVVTPGNHKIDIRQVGHNFEAILLGSDGFEEKPDGSVYDWAELLKLYGKARPGISQIRLKTTDDIENHHLDIVGSFDFDHIDVNKLNLTFDVSTLPASSIAPIQSIIDPLRTHPENGLEQVPYGYRTMILSDIPADSPVWAGFHVDPDRTDQQHYFARVGDIITYDDGVWRRDFFSSDIHSKIYVVNQTSGKQFVWTNGEWRSAIEGVYNEGFWRVFL